MLWIRASLKFEAVRIFIESKNDFMIWNYTNKVKSFIITTLQAKKLSIDETIHVTLKPY